MTEMIKYFGSASNFRQTADSQRGHVPLGGCNKSDALGPETSSQTGEIRRDMWLPDRSRKVVDDSGLLTGLQ